MSREEASQILSISQRALDYLVATKRLPARRIGGRVLIPVSDLRQYAASIIPNELQAENSTQYYKEVGVLSSRLRSLLWTQCHIAFIIENAVCVGNAMEALPIPVKNALRKLGSDIRDARLRRRIPVAVMAQRAFISRTTLVKLEKGYPGVAIGTYAAVLFALGMIDRLRELAEARSDEIGLALEEERLPKRIEIRPRRTTNSDVRKQK